METATASASHRSTAMNHSSGRSHQLGRTGEQLATLALKARGFEIIARNVRTPSGELDVIARDTCGLVFVEVKTRSSRLAGQPYEAVDQAKRRRLEDAAREYLEQNDHGDVDYRFGIISIVTGGTRGDGGSLEWIDEA